MAQASTRTTPAVSAKPLAEAASTKPSTSVQSPASAIAPKRARGKARVAAILDAGAAVFAEKGYDGATMTEIAARADTAIGSLYRFFPTKSALADVMLANYKAQLHDGLDALMPLASSTASQVDRMPVTPAALATALIDLMLSLRANKDGVIAALDGRGDSLVLRSDIRVGMRERLANLLAAATGMVPIRARVCAGVLQQLLKSVTPLANEDAAVHAANEASRSGPARLEWQSYDDSPLLDELRSVITLYLQHIFAEGTSLAKG